MKYTLAIIVIACFVTVAVVVSCTKNSNPQPPVHDTVTVVQKDTLYATKPDPTVNLTKGLLLYLPFTNSIADSSGNNNPTAAVGTPLTYDAHGYANSAFGSTGNGTEVIVTNNGSIQFDTAFSVSFGFMLNSTSTTQCFMSLTNPANGYGATFDLGLVLPANSYFAFGVADISSSCNAIPTNTIIDTTTWTPVPGSWYNCISIYHRGGVQTYINGVLIHSKQSNGTEAIDCPSSQFVVGGWWNGQNLSMNGKLDNIRLYNRVLTPHEIAALSSSYQITSNRQRPSLQTH